MGERLPEVFMRGSRRSAVVDPCLFQEVLLSTSKAPPPCPVQGLGLESAACAVQDTVCSCCFLEMFQGVDPSPLARFEPCAFGESGWRGPACLMQVHAADLGQVGEVRGPPSCSPSHAAPCKARGNTEAWLCLRAPTVWEAQGFSCLGFANRWEFASPWWWPSSLQRC